MMQFLNTVQQILQCDSVGTLTGLSRHLQWQIRKVLRRFPCELTLAGSRLWVDRPGGVAALVNAMGEYDYNNMCLLRLVLTQEESTFIDVGANIGSYTLIASQVASARVVSIEPHPTTFALLENNVRVNDRRNVICLNLALSDCDGDLHFTDGPESSVNRVVQPGETTGAELHVSCRRLDALCRELEVVPDFVKIDVEGHECAVLKGFGDLRGHPRLFFIEGGESQGVRRWMCAAGYSGPWFVHFDERVVSPVRQRRPEDPVFVHPNFISHLRRMNFDLSEFPI